MVDLKPSKCFRCDLGTGMRGMDLCHVCEGTGSIFWVAGVREPFANTEDGYQEALAAKSKVAVLPVVRVER